MYYFLAHYINMNNGNKITRKIEFNGQFLDSEKECYLYAISKAYDKAETNEMLASLEFIAC